MVNKPYVLYFPTRVVFTSILLMIGTAEQVRSDASTLLGLRTFKLCRLGFCHRSIVSPVWVRITPKISWNRCIYSHVGFACRVSFIFKHSSQYIFWTIKVLHCLLRDKLHVNILIDDCCYCCKSSTLKSDLNIMYANKFLYFH